MSNERSPREVCSMTIGMSGLMWRTISLIGTTTAHDRRCLRAGAKYQHKVEHDYHRKPDKRHAPGRLDPHAPARLAVARRPPEHPRTADGDSAGDQACAHERRDKTQSPARQQDEQREPQRQGDEERLGVVHEPARDALNVVEVAIGFFLEWVPGLRSYSAPPSTDRRSSNTRGAPRSRGGRRAGTPGHAA